MSKLIFHGVSRNGRAACMRALAVLLLAGPFTWPVAWGQVFGLTRDQMIKMTGQSPYERFPDGRPKVPDALLEKVKSMSSEDGLGMSRSGFTNQFADCLQVLNPGKKLVGRAMTLKMMPLRPDVADAAQAEWKAKGGNLFRQQAAIDMLQPGDVLVIDVFGSVASGAPVGNNLAYYIWKTTGAGFVIDGAIRDLDEIAGIGMAGYFRGATPPSVRDAMAVGINVPVRICNVTVMPGDVVLGDREGVSFIPPHLVKQLADEAETTRIHDKWVQEKFDEGKYKSSEVYGRSTSPELMKEYKEYLKQHKREPGE
jgi:4-hydroxy-4-methyl-2-oxoglutarate aldolase